jgi:hypothetical protein
MSAAADALAVGFTSLLAHHGETMELIPASAVVRAENGEAVTDESGVAVLSDDDSEEFTGIFDEAFVLASPSDASAVSIVTAVIALASVGIAAGSVIIRDDVSYYVQKAEAAAIDGSQVFIVTKQIQ